MNKYKYIYHNPDLVNPWLVKFNENGHLVTIKKCSTVEEAIQVRDEYIKKNNMATVKLAIDLDEHPEKFFGQKFGKLTIVGTAPKGNNRSKKRVFRCLCDCGNFVDVYYHDLVNGAKKSCGCFLAEDLRGRKFGELTVLDIPSKRGGLYVGAIWTCQCSCGKIVEATGDQLVSGSTISCGHVKIQNAPNDLKKDQVMGTRVGNLIRMIAKPATCPYDRRRNVYRAQYILAGKLYRLGAYSDEATAVHVTEVGRLNAVEKLIDNYHATVLSGKERPAGVTFENASKKWLATIMLDKKRKIIGKFKTKEEAIKARFDEEEKLIREARERIGSK